jgi:hypothetical protein
MTMENIEELNHYDGAEVIERFNIEKQVECASLDNWLKVSGTLTVGQQEILTEAQIDMTLVGRDCRPCFFCCQTQCA